VRIFLNISTLHIIKLIQNIIHRGNGGRREFTENDMDFVDLISCLKETGMSLKEIRDFVNMSMAGNVTLEQRLAMFKKQRDEVMEQIKQS